MRARNRTQRHAFAKRFVNKVHRNKHGQLLLLVATAKKRMQHQELAQHSKFLHLPFLPFPDVTFDSRTVVSVSMMAPLACRITALTEFVSPCYPASVFSALPILIASSSTILSYTLVRFTLISLSST